MFDKLGVVDSVSFEVKKENQIVRDGCVGILYSPRHGTGWYTWHGIEELLRDPEVVHLVECRAKADPDQQDYYSEKIHDYCTQTYGENSYGGVHDLTIEWVPLGTCFRILESDGAEMVEYLGDIDWMKA